MGDRADAVSACGRACELVNSPALTISPVGLDSEDKIMRSACRIWRASGGQTKLFAIKRNHDIGAPLTKNRVDAIINSTGLILLWWFDMLYLWQVRNDEGAGVLSVGLAVCANKVPFPKPDPIGSSGCWPCLLVVIIQNWCRPFSCNQLSTILNRMDITTIGTTLMTHRSGLTNSMRIGCE